MPILSHVLRVQTKSVLAMKLPHESRGLIFLCTKGTLSYLLSILPYIGVLISILLTFSLTS